ncbi:MAG: porin [Bacteroidales bacterium]
MKKVFALAMALACGTAAFAENPSDETTKVKSLFARLFNPEMGSEKLKVTLHTKGSLNSNFSDGKMGDTNFKMEQFRIELRGDVNDRIYYRYQQRLTSFGRFEKTVDNLPITIDYAGLGYRINQKVRVFGGKMCTAYGGIEFDDNPINVYQYSLIHENMTAFLTGIDVAYDVNPNHELRFQMLDGRNGTMEDTYGKLPASIEASKADFVYTFNWNGKFGPDNMFSTRWSASVLNEAKDHNMYYGVLGTAMNYQKFGMFLDLMYSREELDRKGIISRLVASQTEGYTQTNTDYSSIILGMNYRFAPKWNLVAKGIWDTASKYKGTEIVEKGRYLNAFGCTAGIEYYPIKNDNLHLNLVYTGRKMNYTDLAKKYGATDRMDNKIELSVIYAMRIF